MPELDRIDRKILDEPDFQAVVMEHYLQRVFATARQGSDVARDA